MLREEESNEEAESVFPLEESDCGLLLLAPELGDGDGELDVLAYM